MNSHCESYNAAKGLCEALKQLAIYKSRLMNAEAKATRFSVEEQAARPNMISKFDHFNYDKRLLICVIVSLFIYGIVAFFLIFLEPIRLAFKHILLVNRLAKKKIHQTSQLTK
jgi:hypothetical protein